HFGDKRIERVEHRDSLDALGKAFVGMILSQPDADRLLYVIPGSSGYPASDLYSWAEGYSSGCMRMFLETCAHYGDGTQAKRFRSLLERSEDWTRDAAVRRRWEAVEAHNSFAWDYETLRDDYLHRKEAAIHLMQLR